MYFGNSGGRVMGVAFDEHPGKLWGRIRDCLGYYFPKRNSKAGKKLYTDMERHRGGLGRGVVGKAFLGAWCISSGGGLCGCGWEKTNHGIILKAPEGTGEENWKPIAGLRKLKASEYWAIKEAQPKDESE